VKGTRGENSNYITFKEALQMWRFYHLLILMTLGTFLPFYVANVYKIMADGFLLDHTLAIAASAGNIVNGASRFAWSTLIDKFGFKYVYFVLLFI